MLTITPDWFISRDISIPQALEKMIDIFGHYLEIVTRAQVGFVVQPKRWIVERAFAWLGRNRRLSKDYEGLPATTEAWCYLAMSKLMLRRLACRGL